MSLTRPQLSNLERELERNHDRLLEEVRNELAATDGQQYAELVNRDPTDPGDASMADLLATLNLAEIDRHIAALRDIEASRLRIREGSYGTCVDCGREIGFERLQAYPTAKRCLPCQQLHERIYASEGTPTL
ncbi:MAG: TraR/DksA family transcriptional regulator [Ignavibacteria bacterium]